MSMTREEAIVVLEESKRQNEVMRDNPSTFWASHQMAEGVKNAEKRIAALDLALTALHGPTREQVEKVWRGEWAKVGSYAECKKCGHMPTNGKTHFCPYCGDAKTDEAVDMMLERWKEATSND